MQLTDEEINTLKANRARGILEGTHGRVLADQETIPVEGAAQLEAAGHEWYGNVEETMIQTAFALMVEWCYTAGVQMAEASKDRRN